MRSTEGWVLLARNLLSKKDISGKPNRLSVLMHLMFWAQYEKGATIDLGGEPYQLGIGELVTSLPEISKATGIAKPTVDRILKYLEKRETISQKVRSTGRVIKLQNYSDYQDFEKIREKRNSKNRETSEKRVRNGREYKTNKQNNEITNNTEPQKFLDLYYANFPTNRARAELTQERIKKINQHLNKKHDLQYWQTVMNEIKRSDWLMRNGSGFRFGVDWLLQKHRDSNVPNHLRIMEGFYTQSTAPQFEINIREDTL